MEESPFKVLLEVNMVGSDEGRLGVDLVTILDIGDTMTGFPIVKAKLAIKFLLQKLSHVDRLSIVTFSKEADKLCPLRQITESSRMEIANQINALEVESSTNFAAGLKMALKILDDRTHTKRRRAAIVLISNGIEDDESNAASVPIGKVPVHTFGLGSDCDREALSAIAAKSDGGKFKLVPDLVPLSAVFSTSLAGLLEVVMEDLTLTIAPENGSKITLVNSLNYHQQTKGSDDLVTLAFGSLCHRETCKVLVKLTLPKVDKSCTTDILKIRYNFRVSGEESFESAERIIHVVRNALSREAENENVLAEERRIEAFALALESSHEPQRSVTLPVENYSKDPENYVVPMAEEDKKRASPIPEAPKQEGWGFGRFKQVVDLGYNIADKLKEHDPRAVYSVKK